MVQKLKGAHFRMLNEKLYTIPSDEAASMFKEEPHLFDAVSSCFSLVCSCEWVVLVLWYPYLGAISFFLWHAYEAASFFLLDTAFLHLIERVCIALF